MDSHLAVGTARPRELLRFSREDVFQHRTREDCWIILFGEVYNVTAWLSKHPGGAQILLNHAGEDATLAWTTFHKNKKLVSKYMSTYHIGSLVEEQKEHPKITRDYLKLHKDLEEKGLFEATPIFNILMLVHAILFEVAAWWILYTAGDWWTAWIVSGVFFATSQIQLGWLQHDLVHGTVFSSTRVNRIFNDISLGLMQGVPINWWDGRHYLHHAKPNVIYKDPDITMPFNFFLLGKTIPKEWGAKHWGLWPYQFQHIYFILTAPTFGITFFYQVEFILQAVYNAKWKHLLWLFSFVLRFYLMYYPLLGSFGGLVCWYYFMRFVESQWYVWVSQINHIPMDVEAEKHLDWVTLQLRGTCNVKPSLFKTWLCGHLNYQIEHHLFPAMPRSNYHIIQPRVKEFCQEHGLVYEEKDFWEGVYAMIKSLKDSGQLWADAWKQQSKRVE